VLKYLRPVLIICLIVVLSVFYVSGGREYLRLENVQDQLHTIQELYHNHPLRVILIYFGIYVLITSLSIPGSIVLTVLAGSIYGTVPGTILVSLAGCLGASLAFLMARFLFKDFIRERFHEQYQTFNEKIESQGLSYLFTLRLIPASPYVVINLVMGVTSMNLWSFAWVTFVGMLPGTLIYVFAGRKFAELESLSGILSWPILLCLLTLSLFPYLIKFLMRKISSYEAKDIVN
jgi:uncharacterized membrane protein YdjX (TVP38/TMEM64 family)